jgi:polyhydroxyalkanoate synthesis regulator phasin
MSDPECQAVRDHREVTILLRAEVTALVKALVDKGVITQAEFSNALLQEAQLLNKDYEKKFPGVTASMVGLSYTRDAADHMKNWKP